MSDERSEPTALDQEPEQVRTPPPPRKSSRSAKRTPPPPRRGQPLAGGSNGDGERSDPAGRDQVAALIKQNQELMARLERLESGGMRTTEPSPAPKPEIVVTEGMSDFIRGLVGRTHEAPADGIVQREPLYNVPSRTYLKPPPKNRPNDPPTVVKLQGDAGNRAYYQDKGLYLMTPDEARQYWTVEYPQILQEQRTRAALINALRLLVKREATLSGYVEDTEWDDSLSGMTVAHLEEEWRTLCRQTPNPERRLPRAERAREERDTEGARLLAGVEMTPPRARTREFEDEAQHAAEARQRRGRDIEVTPENWNQFR